jgi:magnesium transporter
MQAEDQLTLGYVQAHPLEVARRLESVTPQEAADILSPLPSSAIAAVLECCLPAPAARIVACFNKDSAGDVITHLSASSAIGVLRQFEEPLQHEILEGLEKAIGASLRRAMRYLPHTAGSLADPRVLTLPPDITVEEALERVKLDPGHTTYYVYVIDRDTKLEGLVTLKQLISCDTDHLIATIMTDNVITLSAEANIEEILQHPQWERFPTLPVVDRWGTFLGALRYRTLRGIEQEHVRNPDPGSLSQAFIQLWEAYSLAGIGIMTDMATSIESRSHKESGKTVRQNKENT